VSDLLVSVLAVAALLEHPAANIAMDIANTKAGIDRIWFHLFLWLAKRPDFLCSGNLADSPRRQSHGRHNGVGNTRGLTGEGPFT
jgi:hypothetical protein